MRIARRAAGQTARYRIQAFSEAGKKACGIDRHYVGLAKKIRLGYYENPSLGGFYAGSMG